MLLDLFHLSFLMYIYNKFNYSFNFRMELCDCNWFFRLYIYWYICKYWSMWLYRSYAVNYNASVTLDDGSCIPYIYGSLILQHVMILLLYTDDVCIYCDISFTQFVFAKILLVIVMGGYWLNSHLLILQLLTLWSNGFVGSFNMNLCLGIH